MESHATNEQLHLQVNRWKAMAENNAPRISVNYSASNNAEKIAVPTQTFSLIQEAKADIRRMKQSIPESKFGIPFTNLSCRRAVLQNLHFHIILVFFFFEVVSLGIIYFF